MHRVGGEGLVIPVTKIDALLVGDRILAAGGVCVGVGLEISKFTRWDSARILYAYLPKF
jgi:hypothetical protein